MHLDKKPNFAKHINETCKKYLKTLKALWPMLITQSKQQKFVIQKCIMSNFNIKSFEEISDNSKQTP